ncbi:Bacterial PH domain protein [uncultured archaeon]|nr:Bacterial PH domain protein [uncultured archaeon]
MKATELTLAVTPLGQGSNPCRPVIKMKFHISRWNYWWAYLIVTVLVLLAIWFSDKAYDRASWISGGVALILFLILELLIRSERVIVDGENLELRQGLLSKESTRISCKSVSNVSVSQSFLQRLLRYGDLEIRTTAGDYVLRSFEEPGKIERALSKHLKH